MNADGSKKNHCERNEHDNSNDTFVNILFYEYLTFIHYGVSNNWDIPSGI